MNEEDEVELAIEPHSRIQFELAKATDGEEVLGLALGAASTCWESIEGTGEFDSVQARLILQDTISRLRELEKPNLGLATTAEILAEFGARFSTFQSQINQDFESFMNYRTVDSQ